MLKKKILAVLLAVILVLLSACGSKANDGTEYFGDEMTQDTLRICIDAENIGGNIHEYARSEVYNELAEKIKSVLGLDRIILEVVPGSGVERQTALQRLRTEIMAGGGPDVFILNTVGGDPYGYEKALLNFPEKNMESGLFLPLDRYMENNTQFTDWNVQTKPVLDAGRTEEGQVVIPLTYTFPVTVCPEYAVTVPYTTELSMQQVLQDSETASLGSILYTSLGAPDERGERSSSSRRLAYLLGELVDYKNEELRFTENELYDMIDTMFSLHDEAERCAYQYIEGDAGVHFVHKINLAYFDTEIALVPSYSSSGGVTASVLSFAGVNRNTNYPEEAFSVIDFLLQEEMQLNSEFYFLMLGRRGVPLQNDLGQNAKPYYGRYFLNQELFEDLLEIKQQITAVNYNSELDMMLDNLVSSCLWNDAVLKEEVSEVYSKMERMIGE